MELLGKQCVPCSAWPLKERQKATDAELGACIWKPLVPKRFKSRAQQEKIKGGRGGMGRSGPWVGRINTDKRHEEALQALVCAEEELCTTQDSSECCHPR